MVNFPFNETDIDSLKPCVQLRHFSILRGFLKLSVFMPLLPHFFFFSNLLKLHLGNGCSWFCV